MKIKTKIRIVVLLSFCAVFIVSAVLYLSLKRVDKESEEAAQADALAKAIAEFNIFVFEHSIHNEERPLMQARLKYDSIAGLLEKGEFEFPEEQERLDKISRNYTIVGSNLSQIVDIHKSQKPGKEEDVHARGMKKNLENSILFRSQEMVSAAFHLAAMIRTGEERVHGMIHKLLILFVAILTIGFVAISILLNRSVTNPITKLHKGTEIIGSGNLDYKIGITTKDEIGEFSTAFDRMTGNLKSITVSRDEYQQLVDNPFVGVYKTNLKGDILFANEALARIYEFESPEGLMSVSAFAIYKNPEDRKKLIEALRTTSKVENFESEMITHTGKIKNILFNATLEGDVLSGMVLDITGRKQAEAALSKTKDDLERSNKELERKLQEIKTLRGILPICSYCKKIRDDKGAWQQMEMYVRDHSEAEFSHGMCPQCAEKAFKEVEEFKKNVK